LLPSLAAAVAKTVVIVGAAVVVGDRLGVRKTALAAFDGNVIVIVPANHIAAGRAPETPVVHGP
jgi:hypothetical protein